jgi:YidC/Oxa1 family membrane protein insertase
VLLFVWMFKIAPGMGSKAAPEVVPAQVDGGQSATGAAATPDSTAPVPPDGDTVAVAPKAKDPASPADLSTPLAEEYRNLPANPAIVLAAGPDVQVMLDPDKGAISQVLLHKFKNQAHEPTMPLLAPGSQLLGLSDIGGNWKYSHAKVLAQTDRSVTISRWIVGTPMVLEQRFTLDAEQPYHLQHELRLRNQGDDLLAIPTMTLDAGLIEPLDAPSGFFGSAGIDQSLAVRPADKADPKSYPVAKIVKMKPEDLQETSALPSKWLAVQNKYFTSVLMTPEGQNFTGYQLHAPPQLDEAGGVRPDRHLIGGTVSFTSLPLAAGESRAWVINAFIGPKNFGLLKEQGSRLEDIMNFDLFLFFHFGWMEKISRLILWAVLGLHDQFGSYGLAIIIITLILRTIFWPLTHQSTMLSRKMQKIQPLAAEIREKYKSDPQKMQSKTMELYKQHKVNPITGCLPMLLQVPVFFALFNVLRSSIELRQAEWLWVHDLSIPDTIFTFPWVNLPLNPLAITMGAGMILQQRLMPTSADPAQQKMMGFMSLFFVFICYSMPSGLTLYWTVNQICSIVQYKLTHVMLDRKEPTAGKPVKA